MTSAFHDADDGARAAAAQLLRASRFAALAVLTPQGLPFVSRIAFGLSPQGEPVALISQLADHTQALGERPECSLLIGEPGPKGDPLTHPRLTLQATARLMAHNTPAYSEMAVHWLRDHPKAKLYIGFADFVFATFQIQTGHLNGGFGKAYRLTPKDLDLRPLP